MVQAERFATVQHDRLCYKANTTSLFVLVPPMMHCMAPWRNTKFMSLQCHVEIQANMDARLRVGKFARTHCPSYQQRGIWQCQQTHMLLPLPYLAQTTPVQVTFAQLHLHVLFQKQVQKFTLVDLIVQCVCVQGLMHPALTLTRQEALTS